MPFSKAIVLLSLLALFYGTIAEEGDETEDKKFFSALAQFVNETITKRMGNATFTRDVSELVAEFAELNDVDQQLSSENPSSTFEQNMHRNRYNNIKCAEQSRVHLPNGQYIHANWVRFPGAKRCISTQGPLPTTSGDFWTMIVQEGIGTIVMLCNTVEAGRPKCDQYWPTEGNDLLSFVNKQQITVKFEKEQFVEGTLYITDLIVEAPQMRQGLLRVKHFHWRDWPDFGVPTNDLALFHLLDLIEGDGPWVVHCSAGVGRTGTVAAVYWAKQLLLLGQSPDIPALLRALRQQRAQSVQTRDQYLYIYYVILHFAQTNAAKLRSPTSVDKEKLNEFLQKLKAEIKWN